MRVDFRRRLTQFASLIITNREIGNFFNGKIYKGSEKYLCAPGLNCYSCPASTLSCPLGAMQTIGGAAGYGFGFYAFGFILMFGVLFGRLICGFLCPFGLFQELLAKIPLPKKNLPLVFNYIKYIVLILFVILFPLIGAITNGSGAPAFCQYICPSGTLEAAIPMLITHEEFRESLGALFALKTAVLLATMVGCMSIYRFFCRTLCPLGALYGLLNKISLYRMKFDKTSCLNCGACKNVCPMGINPAQEVNSIECIRCGKCVETCGADALKLSVELVNNKVCYGR